MLDFKSKFGQVFILPYSATLLYTERKINEKKHNLSKTSHSLHGRKRLGKTYLRKLSTQQQKYSNFHVVDELPLSDYWETQYFLCFDRVVENNGGGKAKSMHSHTFWNKICTSQWNLYSIVTTVTVSPLNQTGRS